MADHEDYKTFMQLSEDIVGYVISRGTVDHIDPTLAEMALLMAAVKLAYLGVEDGTPREHVDDYLRSSLDRILKGLTVREAAKA